MHFFFGVEAGGKKIPQETSVYEFWKDTRKVAAEYLTGAETRNPRVYGLAKNVVRAWWKTVEIGEARDSERE